MQFGYKWPSGIVGVACHLKEIVDDGQRLIQIAHFEHFLLM